MTPYISIITPVYKAEAFIEKCVNSIVAQTFTNWELILVDDGSPDGSGVLCDKFASKDDRIKSIHKANGGVSSARNLGLDYACGEYVTFIDSDDTIGPTFLERFANNPDIDIIFSGLQRVGSVECKMFGELNKRYSSVSDLMHDLSVSLDETDLMLGGLNFICCKAFRRSILQEHSIRFNQEMIYGEDTCLVFQFLSYANNAMQVEGNEYFYYTPTTAHTYSFTIDSYQNHCILYTTIFKELEDRYSCYNPRHGYSYCVSVFTRYIKGLKHYSFNKLNKELQEFKKRNHFPIWERVDVVRGARQGNVLRFLFSHSAMFFIFMRLYKFK